MNQNNLLSQLIDGAIVKTRNDYIYMVFQGKLMPLYKEPATTELLFTWKEYYINLNDYYINLMHKTDSSADIMKIWFRGDLADKINDAIWNVEPDLIVNSIELAENEMLLIKNALAAISKTRGDLRSIVVTKNEERGIVDLVLIIDNNQSISIAALSLKTYPFFNCENGVKYDGDLLYTASDLLDGDGSNNSTDENN